MPDTAAAPGSATSHKIEKNSLTVLNLIAHSTVFGKMTCSTAAVMILVVVVHICKYAYLFEVLEQLPKSREFSLAEAVAFGSNRKILVLRISGWKIAEEEVARANFRRRKEIGNAA